MSTNSKIKIYAYTTETYCMANQSYAKVKVGEATRQSVKKRVSQGKTYHPENIVQIGSWENLKKINSDRDIHRVLEEQGYKIRGKGGEEWFDIPVESENFQERITEVYKRIDKIVTNIEGEKSRTKLVLRKTQKEKKDQAMDIIKSTKKDKVFIVAYLPPRFGKTPFFLNLFDDLSKEYGTNVMIASLYWLHSSFETDIDKFSDFNDIVYIDTKDPEAEKKYIQAMRQNLRVLINLSLNGDFGEWSKKHKWISKIPSDKKYILCDEGDHGTHTEKQIKKIEFITEKNVNNPSSPTVIISASGTNVQRLAKINKQTDGILYANYCELEVTEPVVKRRFYMNNLDSIIKYVKNLDNKIKPSWVKIWKKPYANKAFLVELGKSLVGLETLRPELNLSNIAEETISVFMLMTSAENKQMNQVAEIFKQTLPNYHIKVLNGDHTTNRKAEHETKIEINEAKNKGKDGVILITNQMASRSYSVPEVQATVLAYDCGSGDSTAQKASRCLTNGKTYLGKEKKYGHIVDLSFDPNRSENIIKLLIVEATQVAKSKGISFPKAMRFVLSAVNCFEAKFGNMVQVSEEKMFDVLTHQEIMLRVADITADEQAALAVINELEKVCKNISPNFKRKKKAVSGAINSITENNNSKNKLSDSQKKSTEKIINQAVQALNSSATSVYSLAEAGETYRECIGYIKNNKSKSNEFQEIFGVSPLTVEKILNENILNNNLLDMIVEQSRKNINIFFENHIPYFPKRHVTNYSLGILGKPDSTELCKQITSHIPDEALLNPDVLILFVACGHGTEADILVRRMQSLGITNQQIKERIYLNDKYQMFTNVIKRKGYVNVITCDYLEWETNMKFDVVIGNPPYKANNNNNFYINFIKKSSEILKENALFAFVIPNRFTNPCSTASKILKSFLEPKTVWVDLGEHFPHIGTNIGAIVGIKKIKNDFHKDTSFIFPDGKIKKSLSVPTPIMKPNLIANSIVEKVFSNTSEKIHIDNTYTGKHYLQVEISYCRYRSTTPRGGEKTLVTNVNHTNGNGSIIPCENKKHAQVNAWFLSRSKLGRFCIYAFANSSFVNANTISMIMPYLPDDTPMNDQFLYEKFDICPEEIDYIENIML